MKIIHFSPKAKGIRFFSRIRSNLNNYFSDAPNLLLNYWRVSDLITTLTERKSKLDIVFISAHGMEDAILKPYQGTYIKTITIKDSHLFKNKFVFANSCFTANELGPNFVKQGALAFVGFNDSIYKLILSDNNYQDNLEKIFKRIYTDSISEAFAFFVKKCLTVIELTELIDFYFRKNLNEVYKMNLSKINSEFQVTFHIDNEKIKSIMKLEFIEKSKHLKSQMTILGEKNYIFWSDLKNLSPERLMDRLTKVEEISNSNSLYKSFITSIIYLLLNDQYNYIIAIEQFEKELKKGDTNNVFFESPLDFSKDFEEIKREFVG